MNKSETTAVPGLSEHLDRLRAHAEAAGVFDGAEVREGKLVCRAKASAAPASYRVEFDAGRLWVSLVTSDRWLSQSIEADLVHTGDKLEDLIAEELVEQGFPAGVVTYEHFRSEDLLFTFRSPVPVVPGDIGTPEGVRASAQWLLAYEACFRNLGDMEAGEDDEE